MKAQLLLFIFLSTFFLAMNICGNAQTALEQELAGLFSLIQSADSDVRDYELRKEFLQLAKTYPDKSMAKEFLDTMPLSLFSALNEVGDGGSGITRRWLSEIESFPSYPVASASEDGKFGYGCSALWAADYYIRRREYAKAQNWSSKAELYLHGCKSKLLADPGLAVWLAEVRKATEQMIQTNGMRVGMYVAPKGLATTWAGLIEEITTDRVAVRMTYTNEKLSQFKKGDLVAFNRVEVQPLSRVTVDMLFKGYE